VVSTPMAHQGLRAQRPAGAIAELRARGVEVVEYIADPYVAQNIDEYFRKLTEDPALKLVIADDPALILPIVHQLSARHVAVVCFDIVPEIREAMAKGDIVMAGDQQPYLQGYLPVVQAGLSSRGRFTGMEVDTGLQLVNRALLPDYLRYSAAGLR
jgi:ABC-type sugar transport system substrate-binding protein